MATMTSTALKVTRASGSTGAIMHGVRLSPDLDEDTIEGIKQTLYRHKVLFFRDQHHLEDDTHAALAHRMGPPYENLSLPEEIIKTKSGMYELDGAKPGGRAESWHTDSTFSVTPPAISILRALQIPEYGGDTTWANCALAYETLHPALQQLADQLWVLHSNRVDLAAIRPSVTHEELHHFQTVTTAKHVSSEHPLVRVHPHTGERSLMVGNYAMRVLDMIATDSQRLLGIFQDHVTRLENTVRWSWKVGDVIMWDNLATQHKVINDWGVQPRLLRRWTVAGDVPVAVTGQRSRVVTLT